MTVAPMINRMTDAILALLPQAAGGDHSWTSD
jgi:hypothetical protein